MFRGIYTATSGMIATQRNQEMLTNNLANAHTPGYKADQAVLRAFPDLLIQRIRDEQGPNVKGLPSIAGQTELGTLHTGVYAQESIPMFIQGAPIETGRHSDLAILDQGLLNPETGARGHLFFAVQGEDGEMMYTRNGQFAVDGNGSLITTSGYLVLDQAGQPINVTSPDFLVTADGRILVEDLNEPAEFIETGRLWLGYTEEPERLMKAGNDLYTWVNRTGEEGGGLQEIGGVAFLNAPDNQGQYPFQIMQGFIEGSNVDATQTMTEMLSTYRLYEANQKVLQAYDRSLEKLVAEVGRVF